MVAALAAVIVTQAAASEGALVSARWLQGNLVRADLYLIDASPTKLHAAAHIPGAVNVDVFTFGGRALSPSQMEQLIRSWGVRADQQVVIYDQGGSYFATSLFFDLYYHGFPPSRLAVLDGGLAAWRAAGGAVTKEPTPTPKEGDFRAAQVREDVRARLPEFLVASGDPAHNALVEALDPEQHFGAHKFFDRAGHVPNAIMAPVADFYNADKTFKSPEEIRRMLDYLGIRPEQHLYAHCGGGIAASVPFFAAKAMLGYPQVKLYKESQLEWLRDDRGLPFWTYDTPNRVRRMEWLSGWNQQMLRAFGVSRIAVIDVRPAASFKQSHVPFAINVPADEFRGNLATPAKLAEILGRTGVDAEDEAVIVSGAGLDPDSAVAYLMLERLGQKRVSVFAESVDDWGFAGLPLVKEDGAVDSAKRVAPPRAYPAHLRSDTVIADAQRTQGLYPKVYLVSGKALPAKLPAGKVIHLPYRELVDDKGSPKAAKDIWAILAKAGLPRYAEIIAIADDPGEAAANYFILKLMGYPDVKVLLL
jgi:3-mercaptopyruvate sulfurtransferase SseA